MNIGLRREADFESSEPPLRLKFMKSGIGFEVEGRSAGSVLSLSLSPSLAASPSACSELPKPSRVAVL